MVEAGLLVFLGATLLILVAPGPDMMYVIARTIGQGRRAGAISVFGVGLGVLVHTVLAAFGLARLFQHVPAAYDVVRIVGAAYLVYLALRVVFGGRQQLDSGDQPPEPASRLLRQAFLTNLLNPKASLFFLAFLPQFADAQGPGLFGQLLALGLMVVALSMAVNFLYVLLAERIAVLLRRSPRAEAVQKWVTASVLGAIALRFAWPGDS